MSEFIILTVIMLTLLLHAFCSIVPEGGKLHYGFNFYPWSEKSGWSKFKIRFKYKKKTRYISHVLWD